MGAPFRVNNIFIVHSRNHMKVIHTTSTSLIVEEVEIWPKKR